ncbi:MAG: hypothetical protein U5R48_08150 [Gammaproteobacteria bacterium]|nr:hypothetical protein [Gammaproteobacteria bacterium]
MARRRRRTLSLFNLSFLDIMSCGFGAVVLIFLITKHSMSVHAEDVNANLIAEVNRIEEDVEDGRLDLGPAEGAAGAGRTRGRRRRGPGHGTGGDHRGPPDRAGPAEAVQQRPRGAHQRTALGGRGAGRADPEHGGPPLRRRRPGQRRPQRGR